MRSADTQIIAEARHRAAAGTARSLRERARLTQADLAAELTRRLTAGRHHTQVARQTVTAWETGHRLPAGHRAAAYGRLLRDLANRLT